MIKSKLHLIPKYALMFLIGLATLFGGCAQYDSNTGSDLTGADFRGTLVDTLIPIDSAATMLVGDINKSASAYLILGRQEGMISDIAFRFSNFTRLDNPELLIADGDSTANFDTSYSIDSATWHSATLKLFGNAFIDTSDISPYTPWTADIFRIAKDFDPVTISYSDTTTMSFMLNDTFATAVDTAELEINIPLDSLVFLQMDTTLASMWDTLAFRVRPSADANFLQRYYSRLGGGESRVPVLAVNATFYLTDTTGVQSSVTSTVNIAPTFNSTLANDSFTIPQAGSLTPERLYVSQGYARRMLYRGDFASLVDSMNTINLAELWIVGDSSNTAQFSRTSLFEVYQLKDEWYDDPDSARFGTSSARVYTVRDSIPKIRLDITPLARFWHSYPDSNFGIGVREFVETASLSRRTFYGNASNVPDTLRPWLRIVYTEYKIP
ncbi:hypothetical protein K8I28_02230 [bacterium]|nr:hypothetical protein [bacterium]